MALETILDRLAPQEEDRGELGHGRHGGTIEGSIVRNLEMFLNARREEFLVPPTFEQTASSIVNFGIPDLTNCGSLRTRREQSKVRQWIEEAIRNFEPRLSVVVVRVGARENTSPLLQFRVEVEAEVGAERITFDLGLKRDTGELAVLQRQEP